MAKSKKGPKRNVEALLAELDQAYRRKQQAYQEFVESIQGCDPRRKADEWMAFTASNIDDYGDQEALVYRRSRRHECKEEIDELVSDWQRAARERIEECARGISVHMLETGETKREGGMPLSKASDIRNVSPYLLHNFWSGRDEQELSIDATMLRTVDWCDIGGFDEYWERLARSTRQDIIQGGIDSVPGSFWLFSMSRSDYAIELMSGALERALEAIELPLDDERYPWRVLREWDAKGKRASCLVDHLLYASAIVFANKRLRSTGHDNDLVKQGVEILLKTQDEHGAWPCWADDHHPSVEASAMCVHALVLAKPRGWERVVAKARKWLWSKQERSGCWVDRGSPDPVYLSVLVLDALDLADGRQVVTFGKQHSGTAKQVAKPKRRFKVALSFPGELRSLVESVAESLARRLGRESVFYDGFHKAELASPNLDTYLQSIYHDQSDLIGVFLCSDYDKKEWCGLEWRAIRDLIKTGRGTDVMLFRTDPFPIPGIFSIDGYIDAIGRSPDELADMIAERLAVSKTQ